MPTCKLCQTQVDRLVRCHIYPEALSRAVAAGGSLVHSTNHESGTRTGYAHGGMYDKEIVCSACEALFKAADDHALDFRRRVLTLKPPYYFPWGKTALPVFPCNPQLLHTFAMQTMLRCLLSDRPEYANVSDDALEAEAKASLLNGVCPSLENRQVAYAFDRSDLGSMMMGPMHHPMPQPMYELIMGNMTIFIASTDQGLPPGFSFFALRDGPDAVVWRTKRLQVLRIKQLADWFAPSVTSTDRMLKGRRSR